MRKAIVIVFTLMVVLGIAGYKLYNKPHRSVEDEQSIKADAIELFSAFETDEARANVLFLDNVIEVTGTVSEILTNQDGHSVLVLKSNDPLFGISCTMRDDVSGVQPGMNVTIKGICTGYLSDVVITNGLLIE